MKGVAIYKVSGLTGYPSDIFFNVPLDDVGDAIFYCTMEAQLLIRYLSLEAGNAGREVGEK